MSASSFRSSWWAVPAAALLAVGLVVVGSLSVARAEEVSDPVGDFLVDTYTGPLDSGLDVVAHQVTLVGDRLVFFGRMDGPIAPTAAFGAVYLFGVDRGEGTPRFLAFEPPIAPNVLWDLIVRVNPDGTGLVNNRLTGVFTPLDPAGIRIDGNEFTASVPVSLLLPAATQPPCEWTYNLWPRSSAQMGTVQVSDLAPDDGNSPVQTIPEVACTTDLAELGPPDHRIVEVAVLIKATDACHDPADLDLLVTVASDEPDDAGGDGSTTGDVNGEDGFTAPVDVSAFFAFNPLTGCFEGSVRLRAERAGSGEGRTYTIEATVVNGDNNSATSSCTVVVPHDESE